MKKSKKKLVLSKYKHELIEKICSERSVYLPESGMAKIIQMAEEDKKIISLGPGEPDFDTPKHIIEFTKKCLDKGFTHYSPPVGRKELRELITRKARKFNKIDCSPENIVVTCGSTEGLLLSAMEILDPGEELFIPNPGFMNYINIADLMDAEPLSYFLREEDGFQLNPDELKQKITLKTRGIILNTPCNPTGTVYKKKLLEEIADIAIENELIILSDEAYEFLVYNKARHVSIGSLNGMQDNVVSLFSFSKTYAMAGFRIGYLIGPHWFTKNIVHLHLYSSLCAPTVSQKAAEAALLGSMKPAIEMRKEYDRRRKLILKRINEISCLHVKVRPEGAFYAFPRFNFKEMNSKAFSEFLLKKASVLTVPGTEFGCNGEGFIRMSYATKYSLIEEAMDRIEKAVK